MERRGKVTAPTRRSPLRASRRVDRFVPPAMGEQADPGASEGPVSEAHGSSPRLASGQVEPPKRGRFDHARTQREPAARPPIRLRQLARSVHLDESDPAPPPLLRTAPDRLALAAGAALQHEPDDQATVMFPPPTGREAPTLARQEATLSTPPPAPSTPPTPPATLSPSTPAPAPAEAASGASIDDVYEQVLERLRRDLLAERERMGDLLGELP